MPAQSQLRVDDFSERSSAQTMKKTMSIGMVLNRLSAEFPDLTLSRIRYYEGEGLLTPQRAHSGYRRFTEADVDRLRCILILQRDRYMPLKVIGEYLEGMDSGQITALVSAEKQVVDPENFRVPTITRLTDDDVAHEAKVTSDCVTNLVKIGLIKPDASGYFTHDDVRIVGAAHALIECGFDDRKLRSLRHVARREADVIESVVRPLALRKTQGTGVDASVAHHQAQEISEQISALVVSLHTLLVKNELGENS